MAKSKALILSLYAQVNVLDDEEAGELFKAILRYVCTGEEHDTDNKAVCLAFASAKAQIDNEESQRKEVGRKRAEAANKRWSKDSESMQMHANDANACKECNCMQTMQMHANDAKASPLTPPMKENTPTPLKESIPPIIPLETTKNVRVRACEADLSSRMNNFYQSLAPYVGKYGRVMVRAFYDYWSEPNQSHTKMRCEMEKTWDTSRRLSYWQKRSNNYGNNQHATSISTPQSRAQEVELAIRHLMSEQGRLPDLPDEMDI